MQQILAFFIFEPLGGLIFWQFLISEKFHDFWRNPVLCTVIFSNLQCDKHCSWCVSESNQSYNMILSCFQHCVW